MSDKDDSRRVSSVSMLDEIMSTVRPVKDVPVTSTTEQPKVNENKRKDVLNLPARPKDWSGALKMDAVGSCNVQMYHCMVDSHLSQDLEDLKQVPDKLLVHGRIQPQAVDEYIKQQFAVPHRRVMLCELWPASVDDVQAYDTLFSYFKNKNRYAVVPHAGVKDCYLMPLDPQDQLPAFTSNMLHSVSRARTRRLFVMVIVI